MTKEKIVYFLGTGFSRPLGLPVMSDFLIKSKDMYSKDPEKYKYFKNVFDTINKISSIKNYYEADLFNIEEILSILEMKDIVSNQESRKDNFRKYLADVIKYHTPEIVPYGILPWHEWFKYVFGRDQIWNLYGSFVGNLIQLKVQSSSEPNEYLYSSLEDSTIQYSIITVNYDTVVESLITFIKNQYEKRNPINLDKIAKLHGSIHPLTIVPHTWNKVLDENIKSAWENAHTLLREATQLRILGYSLPVTDTYVKYLLKSAVTDIFNLKTIDVFCLDRKGDVRKRYDSFISSVNYNFINMDIEDYLFKIWDQFVLFAGRDIRAIARFNQLEAVHEHFIKSNNEKTAGET